jgi:hypothetical protein
MAITRSHRLLLGVALSVALSVALAAGPAASLPTKDYRVQESTRCAYAQGCPRMLRNAVSHAEQFCREEGGPLTGGSMRDFKCEQQTIYCSVYGRIECRGRMDPTKAPGPPGFVVQSTPAKARTCLDRDCNRFVSHAPGEQESGTHACPFGFLVVGVSGEGNNLVCQEFPEPVRETRVEKVLRRHGLLACPTGMLVRGVSEDRLTLLCARLDVRVGSESTQDETENLGLQVCEEIEGGAGPRLFVTGVDVAREKILCAPVTPR